MNKTILFLVFLIAPLALAQHDVLNMLDRTPEGKLVLDNLFIQTKLMGEQLDATTIKNFLKTNKESLQKEKELFDAWIAERTTECEADKKSASELFVGHQARFLAIQRQLESAKRAAGRVDTVLERAQLELENYKKFESYIKENKEAWNEYFETVTRNYHSVEEALHQILETGNGIPPSASFTQISQSYKASLTQIKLKIESANVEYTGMGPILSNLVQIMQDGAAVAKPDVRVAINSLTRNLVDNIRDRLEELEEENEHQRSLFEHLEKAFQENVSRSQKEVDVLTEADSALEKRVKTLEDNTAHAKSLSDKVAGIISMRGEECVGYHRGMAGSYIRNEKMGAIISELNDILASHSGALPSFFIQREIRNPKNQN